MYDLSGKAVLLTGASRGLGAALARALAAEGAQLCLTARDGGAVREVAVGLRKEFGAEAFAREADVRDASRMEAIVEETVKRFGRVDLAVANAGMLGVLRAVHDIPVEYWDITLATNLSGAFYMARSAARAMRATGGGRIAFISSTVGLTPRAKWGAYAVSKFAVEGLMKLMAEETSETGVVAFSINPGASRTRMRREAMPEEDPNTLPDPETVVKAFLKILRRADKDLNGRAFNARDYLDNPITG